MLCGGATEVIGDGDGERIGAIEIGVGCVGPGTGGSINRGGAIAGGVSGLDRKDGSVGEALCVCCRESACDGGGVFCAAAAGVTGDGAGDTGSINQAEVAFGPGIVGEGNLIEISAAACGRRGDIGDGDWQLQAADRTGFTDVDVGAGAFVGR